jgi:hypothetical protein
MHRGGIIMAAIEITTKEKIALQVKALSGKDLWNLLQGIIAGLRLKAESLNHNQSVERNELNHIIADIGKTVKERADAIVNF